MGFMLQRYCGYLNHVNRNGDVMAESRGGKEDKELKGSYERVYERGAWVFSASKIQRALTSKQLKLKAKNANIAGLQLADILAHPVKQKILIDNNRTPGPAAPFAGRLIQTARWKFNSHLYSGRVDGYGTVLFPK